MSYGWRATDDGVVELCDECGYDGRVAGDERVGILGAVAELAALAENADADVRPDPETFSAVEYADHGREVTMALLGYVSQVTGRPIGSAASSIAECADVITEVLDGLVDGERDLLLVDVYPSDVSIDWLLSHLLHDLQHHVLDVRRGLARIAMAELPVVFTVER